MERGMGRRKEKRQRKHIRTEITEMEGWGPEQEESSREHNLRDGNGPRTTVALNSLVLRHRELSWGSHVCS